MLLIVRYLVCFLGCLVASAAFGSSISPVESPAAGAFQTQLQKQVLPQSFHVRHYTFALGTESSELIVSERDLSLLREMVAAAVAAACEVQQIADSVCRGVTADLRSEDVEVLSGTGAAKMLAEWFYSVDHDNWFSWDDIFAPSEAYLSAASRHLFVFRSFNPDGFFTTALAPVGLPVVLDTRENTLTLWVTELFD